MQKNQLLFFVDDNIVANPTAAKELFKALIPLKIRWVGQASIDMANDRELMKLMAQSGCLGHVVGFESIDENGLIELNKRPNLAGFNKYRDQIKVLSDFGLQTWAAFTIGHDVETKQTMDETLEFALHNKFAFAAFNILMPYPRTPLFNKLKNENRLLYNGQWWIDPEYRFNNAAFIPKNMTPEELTSACFDMKKNWNSLGSIFNRMIHSLNLRSMSNAGFMMKMLYLNRKENLKKQNMKFGIQ